MGAIISDCMGDFIGISNESVRVPYDSANAEYIKRQIRPKIQRSSITVCMLSQFTWTSAWIDWELVESQQQFNTIILMGLKDGPANLLLPAPVRGQTWWLWDHEHLFRLIEAAR